MKSLIVAVLALTCVVTGALGAWLSVLPPMIGFSLYVIGGVFGFVALILGLILKLRNMSRAGLVAGVGALPFLVVAATLGTMFGQVGPGINDITTDPDDAPMFGKSTMHGEYPRDFVDKAAKAYPKIQPLVLALETKAALAFAMEVAKTCNWTIADSDDQGFEAYEETSLFRFRDDIVVRVRAEAGGTRIDIRSASRDGKSDFGVNAKRIEGFLGELRKRAQ